MKHVLALVTAGLLSGCGLTAKNEALVSDFRLRYVSKSVISNLQEHNQAEILKEDGSRSLRVSLSPATTVEDAIASAVGQNRARDWYGQLVRERTIAFIVPWFERDSESSLKMKLQPGDVIVLKKTAE